MIARDSRGRKPGTTDAATGNSPLAWPVSLVPRQLPPQIPTMPAPFAFPRRTAFMP